jgi:hypothetical protein
MAQGDTKPDLEIRLSDGRGDVDFNEAASYTFVLEQEAEVIVRGGPQVIEVSSDKKSVTLRRLWGVGETNTPGRIWVSVEVLWADNRVQTFPDEGPLRLDIARKG